MKKLKDEQDDCLTKALLIEHNLKTVDVVVNVNLSVIGLELMK